jgi:hypothetical protein
VIPDIAEAVASPQRLTDDGGRARHVLELVDSVPALVWGATWVVANAIEESLRLEPANENRANWFVETHLLSYLSDAGYPAYLAKPRARMPEATSAGPDAGSRALSPVKPRPPAGSLSEALDSSAAESQTAKQEGDSALAVTADTLAGADTLVVPETQPSNDTETAEMAMPLSIAEGSEADYVLRYRVVLCELSYPEKHRTSPLGSQKVERRASVSLVAQLMQGARQDVVWVGKGNAQQVSMVPSGKLNYLAGTDFPFNPPPLEQKGMGGYVEPMLVTGIVAGLIYLFYANQN